MKISWLIAVSLLSPNVNAECSSSSKIPTEQAYRVIKAYVDRKPIHQLIFGQTVSNSSCKVGISELKQDGSFDLTAEEIASDGFVVRSITYTVPKGEVEANADCSIYSPGAAKNRMPEDNELQWIQADTQIVEWDKPEKDGQQHGHVVSGKRFAISLRQNIVDLSDADLKQTLWQRFFSVPVHMLDCR